MSRSRKKPVIKDRPRNYKKSTMYWRKIRRILRLRVKGQVKDPDGKVLPNPKELEDDYNYSDYTFYWPEEKFRRK